MIVCCLVIRFLFTIIIYIYLLLCYASVPRFPTPPFSYSFQLHTHTHNIQRGEGMLALFGSWPCFCLTQILKCFVFRELLLPLPLLLLLLLLLLPFESWKLNIWSVACKMQLRCCNTHTHTRAHTSCWLHVNSVFVAVIIWFFFSVRLVCFWFVGPCLSFTYFSVTKPETICCFISLCLGRVSYCTAPVPSPPLPEFMRVRGKSECLFNKRNNCQQMCYDEIVLGYFIN